MSIFTHAECGLEASLVEEVKVSLADMGNQKPRRSGFFQRTLDTQYGHIADLKVPKLRHSNEKRRWSILERYQRCLSPWHNPLLNLKKIIKY